MRRAVLHPRGLVEGQLLVADLEDLRGVEPVEGPQAHELIVGVASRGPSDSTVGAHAGLERTTARYSVTAAEAVSTALSRRACAFSSSTPWPGGLDLVEQVRHLLAGVDLQLLPETDLRRGGAGLVLVEERGNAFEPGGQRGEPLRQRGEVAGEDREQGVADGVHRRGAALPDAVDLATRTARDGRCGAQARARSGRFRRGRPGRSPRGRPPCGARRRSPARRRRGCRRRSCGRSRGCPRTWRRSGASR